MICICLLVGSMIIDGAHFWGRGQKVIKSTWKMCVLEVVVTTEAEPKLIIACMIGF